MIVLMALSMKGFSGPSAMAANWSHVSQESWFVQSLRSNDLDVGTMKGQILSTPPCMRL
jgi:hypothetical protein